LIQDFKPGDVLTLTPNQNYREPNKPFFSQISIKGGGDATSAGRAVLQTGEYDYAWNLQVEAQVLNELLQGGKGDLVLALGGGVEQIFFNMADPTTEVDGERSSPGSTHPFLTHQRVRQAMALAIDAGNPDTYGHFSTDAEMFTSTPDSPFPLLYMKRFYGRDPSTDLAQKSNAWSAPNSLKWQNDQYNTLFDAAGSEIDAAKAAADWQAMNDLVVNAAVVVPLIDRKGADAKVKAIQGPNPGPFDAFTWNVADWTRTGS
jgi:ABC-type transport system substrate-binding protein